MVTRRLAECNTPEKRVLFLGGVWHQGAYVLSFVRKRLCLLRADGALEEAKRDGRLVGLQFLFGTAAEVVPVEGTPKVFAVLYEFDGVGREANDFP